ncbi:MAG: flagellar motor switch protein FliN [Clostridiales bacterium]|nr:flagellar motor switch protein FliN [Clostridiales bacterium]
MEDKRLTDEEIDTIGEIMNISMGAAATAVSTMLERQVVITTPSIEQNKLKNIDCSELEPAIVVKINYVQGLVGSNLIVLRRNDMRIILDLLMGNEFTESDDSFEFDDMSMSAASEVMNQMMGASATALSELLGETINISTPQTTLIDSDIEVYELLEDHSAEDDDVMAISFNMTIKETLDTTFTSIMPLEFTRKIVSSLNNEIEETPQPAPQPTQQSQPAPQPTQQSQPAPQPAQQSQPAPQPIQQPQPAPQPMSQPTPQPQPAPMQYHQQMPNSQQTGSAPYPPPYPQPMQEQYQYNVPNPQQAASMPPYQHPYPQQPYQQQQYMQAPYGSEYYAQYNPYPEHHPNMRYPAPMVNVKQADFPEFAGSGKTNSSPYPSNINMLMGVQLEVSVIVGRTKQRIKDVLDFGQGSVIELDKQTGAPAEIVVNGQLLAYGDVVVVGDNFGVRITEIVGTKELLDSLDAKK